MDDTSSQLLDGRSGVPQESVLGPGMFSVFKSHLPTAFKLSDPHLFADDLKILSTKSNWLKVQGDLDAVDNCVKEKNDSVTGRMFQTNLQRRRLQVLSTRCCSRLDKSDKAPGSLRE